MCEGVSVGPGLGAGEGWPRTWHRPIVIPPMHVVAGGLIVAACGAWLVTAVIRRVSPPTAEPRHMAGVLVARGRTLLEMQRLADAYDCFTAAVRLDPAAADGHRGLAAVAYDQGSLMQAVTHLEHAAAIDPADGRPWRMIGHICRDLDHHERAVSSYREALGRELAPATRAEVRVELAEELLALAMPPVPWPHSPTIRPTPVSRSPS